MRILFNLNLYTSQWAVLLKFALLIEAYRYGTHLALENYGSDSFAKYLPDSRNWITLNLSLYPVVTEGILVKWAYLKVQGEGQPCSTYGLVLRKRGRDYAPIHTAKLEEGSADLGIVYQRVTEEKINVQKDDIIFVMFDNFDDPNCTRPLMSARFTHEPAVWTSNLYNHRILFDGVQVAVQIILSDLDPPTLRTKMVCYHKLALSWDVNFDGLKLNLTFLVKCLSNDSTLMDLETSGNKILVSDLIPGRVYTCTVQAKISTKIVSDPSIFTFASGERLVENIRVISEAPGYVAIEFDESVSMNGSQTADDITYKIFCEPPYYAEGKGSPLVLKDFPNGTSYNCSMYPVDKCNTEGQHASFDFTIGAKPAIKAYRFRNVLEAVLTTLLLAAFIITTAVTYRNKSKLADMLSALTTRHEWKSTPISFADSFEDSTVDYSFQDTDPYHISTFGYAQVQSSHYKSKGEPLIAEFLEKSKSNNPDAISNYVTLPLVHEDLRDRPKVEINDIDERFKVKRKKLKAKKAKVEQEP